MRITGPFEADTRLSECIERATHVVDQLEIVSSDNVLPYLYDAGSCTLSGYGVIIYEVRKFVPLSNALAS